jgi:arylsulfatase A-like enzyme
MNVLVIMCDHLRYDAIAAQGNPYVRTPHLDRLAGRSVRFERCYTQAPVCGPARHSLATGKYPYEHGVVNNDVLPLPGMFTVAHALQTQGYRRIQIGPMHWNGEGVIDDGYESRLCPEFDSGMLNEKEKQRMNWEMQYKKSTCGATLRNDNQFWGYQVAQEAVNQLEQVRSRGEKFMQWVSFNEPHPPFFPPKPYYERVDQYHLPLPIELPADAPAPHSRISEKKQAWKLFTDYEKRRMKAAFYGLVELADSFVGMVLEAADRLDLWKDTMIVFTSDHGEQMGDHGLYTKFVHRESSVRVPLLVYFPGCEAGSREQLAEHVDLFPTICEATGAPTPPDVRGKSLWPLLRGRTEGELRDHVFSLIDNDLMIRTREWKLNLYDGSPGELYNMKDDPDELINLIADPEHEEAMKQLLDLLQRAHPGAVEKSAEFTRSTRLRKKRSKVLK